MRIIAGALNRNYLVNVHEKAIHCCSAVKMAVAYAAGETRILADCKKNEIPLIFYGRYDPSVPVALPILKMFLDARSAIFTCRVVPDIFHPKVIWWQDAGVYVGSANMTPNGWFGNIEVGTYFSADEMIEYELEDQLNELFAEIDKYSHPLTDEVYAELEREEKGRAAIREQTSGRAGMFAKKRSIPALAPLTFRTKKSSRDARRDNFTKEWHSTLQILRNIAVRVSTDKYRPTWIDPTVPGGVQADQFLHAFYYSNVRSGNRSLHVNLHKTNESNPQKALLSAMEWWKTLKHPPHNEDVTISQWSPAIRASLAANNVLALCEKEFKSTLAMIHAVREHSLRVRNSTLGLPENKVTNREVRLEKLGEWLFRQTSKEGHTVLETMNYVLYGGQRSDVPNRIWEAIDSDQWRIPELGVSSIGELVGWALPDAFPPRNGRTSKALYALGYPVRIHSE